MEGDLRRLLPTIGLPSVRSSGDWVQERCAGGRPGGGGGWSDSVEGSRAGGAFLGDVWLFGRGDCRERGASSFSATAVAEGLLVVFCMTVELRSVLWRGVCDLGGSSAREDCCLGGEGGGAMGVASSSSATRAVGGSPVGGVGVEVESFGGFPGMRPRFRRSALWKSTSRRYHSSSWLAIVSAVLRNWDDIAINAEHEYRWG